MRLDREKKEQVMEALADRWTGSQHCWICGHEDWTVSERLFELRVHSGAATARESPSAALILVTCPHCGNTILFNAVALGVLDLQGER